MQSISCSRIIGNQHNAVRSAALTVTAQRASTQLLQMQQRRKGNGRMVLSGPYTGAHDSVVDVEVLGGAAGELRASAPAITGVGNGALQVQSIDAGAAAQTLRFTLLDSGTQDKPALLDFFGVQLAARAVGALGNAVSLSVVRNLTFTDLPFATLASVQAGAKDFEGPQFDWGQAAATGADIPAGALRMAFAGLPTVHRSWKTWDKGQFTYHLDPPLAYDVPENTRIRQVSGDYTLTVTDGSETETYTAATMYDFLAQVQARSALVQVLGVVAQDRNPGGQAVTDIPLRTDAHALPAIASAQRGGHRIEVGAVKPGAATQNITITCLSRSGSGADQAWSVSGGVVGSLPAAYSGKPYTAGPVDFLIPKPTVAPSLGASITAKFLPATRAEDEGLPAICFKPLLLGAAATDKEVTFVYKQRPPAECDCTKLPAIPVSFKCLGIDDPGGGDMALDPAYQSRLEALYQWRRDFAQSNTRVAPWPKFVQRDMDFAEAITGTLATALAEVYESAPALVEWDATMIAMQSDLAALAGMSDEIYQPTNRQAHVGFMWLNEHSQKYYLCLSFISPETYLPSSIGWVDPQDPVWDESGEVFTIEYPATGYGPEPAEYRCLGTLTDMVAVGRDEASIAQLNRRYETRMDYVRTLAGIVPKSDAGSAGSPCWRDYGDPFWWEDVDGFYLPAFTNKPFVSAKRDADGKIVSTQEFGFGLVTQCEHRLKAQSGNNAGDRITIRISGTANPQTWGEGDKFVIPLIGAGSAPLTGGENGDPTQTWAARSSLLGALPDWAWLPSAPTAWAHAPASITLAAGGIPFEVGDSIAFDIEGGRLRWRRDGAAWTEADLYTAAPHALGDGLTLQASPGAAPSFLGDDTWQFAAVSTYGSARMRQPRIGQSFAWDGDSVSIELDLGAPTPIEAVMLALHTLPTTASVTIHGGLLAADEWSAPAAVHASIVLATTPAATAQHLRIDISGAGSAGAAVGWLWAGMAWRPTVGPSRITRQRQYGLARGQGINPGALYRGAGTGGSWSWNEGDGGMLLADNAQQLIELIDHSAAQGLEPLALIPDLRASYDASIALIDADSIQMTEMHNWQSSHSRAVSVELPLRAVLA